MKHALRPTRVGPCTAGSPLRDALLQGVVSHLLDVDVEIKWEDIKNPDDEGDEDDDDEDDDEDDMDGDGGDGGGGGAGGGIFELEDIEKTIEEQLMRQAAAWERGGGGAGASPGPYSSHGGHGDTVDEMADALDSMMEETLAHVDTRVDRGDGGAVSDVLLRIFVSTLLPAHRSKFTQFLVFHACARDAAGAALAIDGNGGGGVGGGVCGGGFMSRGVLSDPLATALGSGAGGVSAGAGVGRRGLGLGLASRVVDVMIERLTAGVPSIHHTYTRFRAQLKGGLTERNTWRLFIGCERLYNRRELRRRVIVAVCERTILLDGSAPRSRGSPRRRGVSRQFPRSSRVPAPRVFSGDAA